MLSDEETRQVMRTAVYAAATEKVMLTGVSRDSVLETLKLVEFAAGVGYDAVLLRVPSVLRAESRLRELLTYFLTVADQAALPIVLVSGVASTETVPVEVVIELAAHPRIVGLLEGNSGLERVVAVKEGTARVNHEVVVTPIFAAVTGRMAAQASAGQGKSLISSEDLAGGGGGVAISPAKAAMKTRTKQVGFQILTGRTSGMLDALEVGAVGAVVGFGACTPQACYEVVAAWKDGDAGLAREKQDRITGVAERIETELGPAGVKFGCDLTGYFGGLPRLPLLPLTGAEKSEIEELMHELRG
jgi:dihydrodipicolinate synthase/N-acetylneuraminate lyase